MDSKTSQPLLMIVAVVVLFVLYNNAAITGGEGQSYLAQVSGGELWTQSGNNIYREQGRVGIGINAPTQKLHVKGSLLVENNLIVKGSGITVGKSKKSANILLANGGKNMNFRNPNVGRQLNFDFPLDGKFTVREYNKDRSPKSINKLVFTGEEFSVAGHITQVACRAGETLVTDGLCIGEKVTLNKNMAEAAVDCTNKGGRVCTLGDLTTACNNETITAQDVGQTWIGNAVANTHALFGNNVDDCNNLDGSASKYDLRMYRCCFGPAGGGY